MSEPAALNMGEPESGIHIDPLYERVRADLQQRRGQWARIASETGLAYSTMVRIARGYVVQPGYDKLKRLADYLDANPPSAAA